MMSGLPLVSVITLCYNTGNKYLRTLESIRSQTYQNVELIVVDDASSDNSVEIIKKWMQDTGYTCKLIVNKKNKGICGSLNEGLKAVSGEFVAIIGDDVMLPEKIADDVSYLQMNDELGFCYSNLIAFNESTGEETILKGKHSANVFHDFFSWNLTIYSPTLFYRKNAIDETGFFDEQLVFEDFDYILRLSHRFKGGYRDQETVRYYFVPGKASMARVAIMAKQTSVIINKWRHLKNYRYFLSRQHLALFYNYSIDRKWMSLRFIPRSLRSVSDRRLYRAFLNLFFKW